MYRYLLILLRFIVLCFIAIPTAYLVAILLLDLINYIDVDWQKVFIQFPIKDLSVGSALVAVAEWVWFILRDNQSKRRGREGVEALSQHGYDVVINEVLPGNKTPFYTINGVPFYLHAPFARDISFLLKGIRKLAKHASPKNIVINLADGSVKLEKLEAKLSAKYADKFDKIIIIDKAGQVIRFK